MYVILLEKNAEEQFLNIKSYIKNVLKNSKAAKDFENEVHKKFDNLEKEPYIYPFVNDNKKYRKISIKNYTAIYFVNEQKKTVYITAIVYSGSNYTKYYK